MKKNYLILSLLIAFTMSVSAQTKVIFRVDMRNQTISPDGVHVAGDYQIAAGMAVNWTPSDPAAEAKDPDMDKVYELQVTLAPGNYEYKFLNDNDWAGGESVPSGCKTTGGNRTLTVGTTDLVLDVVCFSSCTICSDLVFERNVTYMVIDSNSVFTDVKIKGTMSSWADFQAYDDGTNGDMVANDKIFTAIYKTKDGEHEWGATNKGSWVIQGSNRKFTMTNVGKITGDTTYGIPKLGALIDVTFSIDMSNETVNTSGVFVAGNFMEALESPIGNWTKDTLKMQPRTTGSDIYSVKVKMHAGKYAWKVWNGKMPKPDDDLPAETFNFASGGCGEVNGLGKWDRVIDFKGATTAKVLTTYLYNSCNASASINKIGDIKFGIIPNPAQSSATLTFKNNGNVNLVTITDLTGRVVLTKNVESNSVEINLDGITKGIYLINAFGTDGSYGVEKLVKN